jgi:hypothetical protein
MPVYYGICAGPTGKLTDVALPHLPGGEQRLLVRRGQSSIHAAYQSICDEAARIADLSALVLLHDDVRIRDDRFEPKLLDVLADPAVGLVGVIGGRDHPIMLWWYGETRGRVVENQHGTLDFGWDATDGVARAQVDTVDGLLLALAPWTVRNVRFDLRHYSGFHGYDAEICARVRKAGRKVLVADLDVHHDNHPSNWAGDAVNLAVADLTWRRRWRSPSFAQRRAWARRITALRAGELDPHASFELP